MANKTEWDLRVAKATNYMRLLGDTQEARRAADRQNDQIDSYQWAAAAKRIKRAEKEEVK